MCITVAELNKGGRMDKRYVEVYTLLVQLEQQVNAAKEMMTMGESPYVKLLLVSGTADKARTAWHTIKEQEG